MPELNLPPHKCGLELSHNTHRNYYLTAKQWLEERESVDQDAWEWANEEQKARAIATDEIWILHWYPHTPIGFEAYAAPTLKELLELANQPKGD